MWLLVDNCADRNEPPYYCKSGVFLPEMFFGRDNGGPFIATARPGEQKPLKVYPGGEKTAVAAQGMKA
jgi:hypothetical protein